MQRILLSVVAVSTFAAASTVSAQSTGRRLVHIGFGGGASVPTSHAADVLKTGVNGQGFILIDTGLLPVFRVNLGYNRFDIKEAFLGGQEGQASIVSGLGGLSMDLIRVGPVRPYVMASLGAFHLKETVDDGTGETESSQTSFGIDGGAGLTIRLGPIAAFIEGRVQNAYTDKGLIDTKTITAIPVTFGILF
jgi:hypothetical protein